MRLLRIATRKSALALWQAQHVAQRLTALHAGLEVELVPLSTRGDQILDRPLADIGGKGLFLKELEVAMQNGEADIAVHSMKDVPMDLDPGFRIAAILSRADAADAFVATRWSSLDHLPAGARIGTSSLRRKAQLRARCPDWTLLDLRGNVNTRLNKLEEGDYDAIILACAGLERLSLGGRIRSRLSAPEWLPAVGQGAIGIECLIESEQVAALVAGLDDAPTRNCVEAERAMNRLLHGSCDVPIAGFAQTIAGDLHLQGLVGDAITGELIRAEASAPASQTDALGQQVGRQLLALGADRLLRPRGTR